MATLYEINAAIQNFEFEFDEETGEVLNSDYLDQLEMDRSEKIENIALYIKELDAEEQAIKDEIKRLQDRAKQKANKREYLKEYLKYNLDGQKFETARCNISFRKTQTVEISDEDALLRWCFDNNRDDLFGMKTTVSPKKTELKKAIKQGLNCPFVGLVEDKSISIK